VALVLHHSIYANVWHYKMQLLVIP
jgi:hypothetical protein